jgi:hypothetical protein
MRKSIFAALIAASLLGGVALAQSGSAQGSLETRLERVEQAIARLEQKLSPRGGGGGMMEGCRDMMGGRMGGMMGGGEPNDQWRSPERNR